MTRCTNRPAIPLPQWFAWRDGAFGGWDAAMARSHEVASEVPWEEKADKAVFHGALRKSTLVEMDAGRSLGWIDLLPENWNKFGRGKLWHLQQLHPDLLDVGICRATSIDNLESVLEAMGWQQKPYMTMEEQAKRYKYVVYLEGTCGWADRLKNLLAFGMVIFMQQTPCHEFFVPLLEPWVHYIPFKNDLSDLIDKIKWARDHGEAVREIALNAADFAHRHLSMVSWQQYLGSVLMTYAERMAYEPVKRPLAKRYMKSAPCPYSKDSKCSIDGSFAI
jgi:hypothetical protein